MSPELKMATLSRLSKLSQNFARALEVPVYQLFCDGDKPAKAPAVFKTESSDDGLWGSSGKDAKFLNKLRRLHRRC
jgi:hypothetical protein